MTDQEPKDNTSSSDQEQRTPAKPSSGGCGRFIWNEETKELLGRTLSSWFRIIAFYIVFYTCLIIFWMLMLFVFYQTLDKNFPKYKITDSDFGMSPGVSFRPTPLKEDEEFSLIWLQNDQKKKHYSESLTKFLKPYASGASGASDASKFDIKQISKSCSAEQDFGYKKGTPCVLIKINRIYGWKPEPYTADQLKEKSIPEVARKGGQSKNSTGMVYVSCEGQRPEDTKAMGKLSYYPEQGIQSKYFPYTNQKGYLSPFVFVHFTKPTAGVDIRIVCKIWAGNIHHPDEDDDAIVHFRLRIEAN